MLDRSKPGEIRGIKLDGRSEDDLREAARIVQSGGLIVFPTETVYGLGADAFDSAACAKIFAAKGRPSDNPLITHLSSIDALPSVAAEIPDLARILFQGFSPGPITVILKKQARVPDSVTAGLGTVGVRIPGLDMARRFLSLCEVPVAAPSANRSGRPSPTRFDMAVEEMEGRVDGIIRGPDAIHGLESTIVFPEGDDAVHILRPGSVGPEEISAYCAANGFKIRVFVGGAEFDTGGDGRSMHGGISNERRLQARSTPLPAAPGTRYRHYNPSARISLFTDADEFRALVSKNAETGSRIAVLTISGKLDSTDLVTVTQGTGNLLSEFSGLAEYARSLYHTFVEADRQGCGLIIAWLPPARGLGIALADRLRRAAGENRLT